MTIELMKEWLEALEKLTDTEQTYDALDLGDRAIKSLRQAIEQTEKQEPVAVHQYRVPLCSDWYDGIPDHHDGHGPYEVRTLYTTPQPQRKWVGFTDEEKQFAVWRDGSFGSGVLWADAQLKEKNK